MNQALVRQVWERAGNRCEYCRIPHPQYRPPFQIDHIIARQHGGTSTLDNLALACLHCNRHKGPTFPAGMKVKLSACFIPGLMFGKTIFNLMEPESTLRTPVGRVTTNVLDLNADDLLLLRVELLREGPAL